MKKNKERTEDGTVRVIVQLKDYISRVRIRALTYLGLQCSSGERKIHRR